MQEYVRKNLSHVLTLIFLAGMAYAEFKIMQMEIDTIEDRLNKKIKIINDLEDRIIELEKCK